MLEQIFYMHIEATSEEKLWRLSAKQTVLAQSEQIHAQARAILSVKTGLWVENIPNSGVK